MSRGGSLRVFLSTLLLSIVLVTPAITLAVSPDATDSKIVELINLERQKKNLSPYKFSDHLFQAAAGHNQIMSNCTAIYGSSRCFSHQVTKQNEPTLMTRISQTGYNPQSVGEIIALGYTSPSSVVAGWMRSTGHRNNILNSTRVDAGCDYLNKSGRWYTCDFGKSYGAGAVVIPSIIPSSSPSPSLKPSVSSIPASPIGEPSPTPTASSKPWWCSYVPTHALCR